MSGYVSQSDEEVQCNSEFVGGNEILTFEFYGQQVAIASYRGRYLSAPADGTVCWCEGEPGSSQLFTVLKAEEQSGSRLAFKSGDGRYLCVEMEQTLSCAEESLVREEQLFEICISGNTLGGLV